MALVVDASVWVAAADKTDLHAEASRAFLVAVTETGESVLIPGSARLEIACALARRFHDPDTARTLATAACAATMVRVLPMDDALLHDALHHGTERRLRAGDAWYAAVARGHDAILVSWDRELITRAAAVTPEEWLARRR